MPRRPAARSRSRAREQPAPRPTAPLRHRPGGRPWKWVLIGLSILVALAAIARLITGSPDRLRAEAERAERAGDQARCAAGLAGVQRHRTSAGRDPPGRGPGSPGPGRGRRGRGEPAAGDRRRPGRPRTLAAAAGGPPGRGPALDAQRVVWDSYDRVPAETRREVLRGLTLALLADVPDESVRAALKRWIGADPADVDARVAMLQRIAAQPRAADPDRSSRLAELETLVAEHPEHRAREALVTALADAGEPDRGRVVLDGWPGSESDRDARYWRLRGRWELEYDRHPEKAEAAFRRALETFPHDWRSWSGLARALTRLGRDAEARQAALAVGRIREVLEPTALGPASTTTSATSTIHGRCATSPTSPITPGSPAWPAPGAPRPRYRPRHRPADDFAGRSRSFPLKSA